MTERDSLLFITNVLVYKLIYLVQPEGERYCEEPECQSGWYLYVNIDWDYLG
jgi:hypothetical protein